MQYTAHGYPYPLDTDTPDQLRTALQVGAERREKDAPQPTTTMTYDGQGRITQVVESSGGQTVRTTTFTYDATSGLLTQSVEVMDGRTETTNLTYNATTGLLTSATVTFS